MNRILMIAACAPLAFAAGPLGCAGSKPPEPNVAANATGTGTSTTAATGAPQQTQTAPSNVSISDDIRAKCGISDTDAYFDFDSANVTNQDVPPLNQVAQCFTSGPLAGHALRLVGRANPRGPDEYNMLLGHERADAVQAYLSVKGLDKSKAESTSRGALDATGQDESGWAKDRRVDILLAQ